MKRMLLLAALALSCAAPKLMSQGFTLCPEGYFRDAGVDVMAFNDFYPEGHQGGISLIMNGDRIATNGDIRLEETPGQWQAVPRQLSREVADGAIVTTLCYPDSSRHLTGFNPMIYPDYAFTYTVRAEAVGQSILVTVDLDTPVPDFLRGKVGFNLEFFPGRLFGKPWIMDGRDGIYPWQPNSPLQVGGTVTARPGDFLRKGVPAADLGRLAGKGYSPMVADDIVAEPYAVGKKFISRPDDRAQKVTVEALTGELKLYDGRMNHNNGWFVLRSEIAPGVTKGAVRWLITPQVDRDWRYAPVVQTSQVGYFPSASKVAVIELDSRDDGAGEARLVRIGVDGEETVMAAAPESWGRWLRYNYLKFDFSEVSEPGLYQVAFRDSRSPIFRINADIYDRGVWQPVIEYFLPVQMCHAEVREKYRVWHGACHLDDALMAPDGNHIDGYVQEAGISPYEALQPVPGVNVGGWHDAGDYDLRVESQAGEAYILALTYEAFRPDIDVTSIDHARHLTEIHQPDGRNDILQQVENGAMSVVAGHKALGRFYRGIICGSVRQYVLLGDAASMTDGVCGGGDDRWVFTEDNPMRDLSTAAALAAISRVLRGFNDSLSADCLALAEQCYAEIAEPVMGVPSKHQLAAELYLTTGGREYAQYILDNQDFVVEQPERCAWYLARVERRFSASGDRRERAFSKAFLSVLPSVAEDIARQSSQTPYGVPYRPSIWGAGWDIQSFAYRQWFLVSAYPDIFSREPILGAVNFVLGCHPGRNQSSFASGVGAQSATVAYGANRADWSYIPGGVVSGTALIRPDFPELLEFPYLWQQAEYCLGGASSHYMFIVLAAKALMGAN